LLFLSVFCEDSLFLFFFSANIRAQLTTPISTEFLAANYAQFQHFGSPRKISWEPVLGRLPLLNYT
jgi:hypothetical protein